MKRKICPITTVATLTYLIVHNITRKVFLDRPFDLIESITGAIIFSIVFYLIYKYVGNKLTN